LFTIDVAEISKNYCDYFVLLQVLHWHNAVGLFVTPICSWICVERAFSTIVTRLRYLLRSSSPKLPPVYAFTNIVSVHAVVEQRRLLSFEPQKCVYNYC